MLNILMALIIAGIIVVIAMVKTPKMKAIVYGLPIPITVALIASQKGVNESHIIGLGLLVGFLWLVKFLQARGWHVIFADLIAAIAYVSIGYVLVKFTAVSFEFAVFLYVIAWGAFVTLSKRRKIEQTQFSSKRVSLWLRAIIVFCIAYFLLETKDFLSGIIVTFPFSGVFAVIEMKENLNTLAREFTKNSIAILAFFIAVWATMNLWGIMMAILVGWAVYAVVFRLVKKL
jgi:hypothetical protein